MIAQLSKFLVGLFTMVFVAGGIYAAFVYGGGRALAPGGAAPTPTRFIPDDRSEDTGQRYPTAEPAPLNAATAEAWSLSVYKTAVADAEPSEPTPAANWSDALPDCATGRTPCVFTYSSGPPQPASANLATGGTNEGTEAHPQKDTDQAKTFNGDKP